ncbi:hypothetical protein HK405_003359 [Cladochytrium tenue]|nr:hypothetical protein HK405_003359 [Cladochytrium tenue]
MFSPLRALRRDADTLRMIISAFRAARVHIFDWTQHGVWPRLPAAAFRVGSGYWSATIDMLSGTDFNAPTGIGSGAGDTPSANIDRRTLVANLGDRVEPFHVNMLPIIMGQHSSLPDKCKRYSDLINQCLQHCPDEVGKVGYLTVQECWVEPGDSQRRPGVHIESPVFFDGDGGVYAGHSMWCVKGGIFQASNVPDTCRVWDCVVRDHADIVGPLGSLEHLRHTLDAGPHRGIHTLPIVDAVTFSRNGENLLADCLAWMTDRTPHESLPVQRRVFRQYFRLVTSQVSVWYEDHSTRNDECSVAPPDQVTIVAGDKFRAARVENDYAPELAPASFL